MPLGYKCNHVVCQCVIAFPTIGCETIGDCCQNYFIGLMATSGKPTKDANNEWQPPTGAMRGHVIPGLGWQLDDCGYAGEMLPGDLVLTAAAKGEKPLPVNEAWFAHHWLECQQKDAPMEYDVTFWRPGELEIRTLTLTRAYIP